MFLTTSNGMVQFGLDPRLQSSAPLGKWDTKSDPENLLSQISPTSYTSENLSKSYLCTTRLLIQVIPSHVRKSMFQWTTSTLADCQNSCKNTLYAKKQGYCNMSWRNYSL